MSARLKVGVLFLGAMFATPFAVTVGRWLDRAWRSPRDEVVVTEARLQRFRDFLPATAVVAYALGDPEELRKLKGDEAGKCINQHQSAQFAIAPAALVQLHDCGQWRAAPVDLSSVDAIIVDSNDDRCRRGDYPGFIEVAREGCAALFVRRTASTRK